MKVSKPLLLTFQNWSYSRPTANILYSQPCPRRLLKGPPKQVNYSEKCTLEVCKGGLSAQVVLRTSLIIPDVVLNLLSALVHGLTTLRFTGQKGYYPPGNHYAIVISRNVLFPGHNHLLTTSADDLIIRLSPECWLISVRSLAPVVSRWLWPGNKTFLEVTSMVVTWWIVAFFAVIVTDCVRMDMHWLQWFHP